MMRVLEIIGKIILSSIIVSGVTVVIAVVSSAEKSPEDRARDDADQLRYLEEYNRRKAAKKRSS